MDSTKKTVICETDWRRVLMAWMHDPVDKALSIPGHEKRASLYFSAALSEGQSVSKLEDVSKSADIAASVAERIPMPKFGPERSVGPSDGPFQIFHPVSAQSDTLTTLHLSEGGVLDVIKNIVGDLPKDPRLRFLALWRLLPDRLCQRFGLDFARLPADTRVPDHSLIQHVDITSGIQAARQYGHGYAILSATLGPVQSFIQAARSVRDLWSGSALLSWLIFQGIRPIIRDLGPTVMVYPALRGNPLADLWLREIPDLKAFLPKPPPQACRAPCLPNRFVALVPNGKDGVIASAFAEASRTGIHTAWQRLANRIRDELNHKFLPLDSEWAKNWDSQIRSFFEVTTSICPVKDLDESKLASLIGDKKSFIEVWQDADKVRKLCENIPLRHRYSKPNKAGQWQAQLEASARYAEAQRSIRHIPSVPLVQPSGPKCSLLGTYEQMGPANLRDSAEFWRAAQEREDVELWKSEQFCAIALCKRFAPKQFLCNELDISELNLRFPDTATVAAKEWLQRASINFKSNKWNGRWLHQRHPREDGESVPQDIWKKIKFAKNQEQLGNPPSYYAILAMDADDMGFWLKGEKAPHVRDILHPKLKNYFERHDANGLEAKRPVGPALHGAISEALNNFASFSAPSIVEDHRGTLIYSGGDDVLALLPARNAIQCARALRKAFRGQNGNVEGWAKYYDKHILAMGSKATLSVGIAFVHYKEDLRGALRAAREAEKSSKDRGKNRLTLKFMRRSGEHTQCELSWELACWFQAATETFGQGVSNRWIYLLQREEPVLSKLPPEAVHAEIRRLINRSEAMGEGQIRADAMPVDRWWPHITEHAEDCGGRLKHFINLCLGASFIARGFDDR